MLVSIRQATLRPVLVVVLAISWMMTSWLSSGFAGAGGAERAARPNVAAALELQEPAAPGSRIAGLWQSYQLHRRL